MTACFYPRPRTGGDRWGTRWQIVGDVFLSAPPHGGRRASDAEVAGRNLFLSAPPHGGRLSF